MKKLLKQYTDLQAEIRDLEARITKLEGQADKIESDSVKGSHKEFPYNPRVFRIEGVSDRRRKRIIKLKELLAKRKEKCEEMKLLIEEFISTIPDSRTRRVFQYRYIDDLTWQAIANRIGRYDESYPRKIIHDKYLENPFNPK